ncbi:MAG: ABC transporter permease [Bacilli bacterium]
MTVFKTFWQVVNKYKGTVILYTVLLIVFGGLNYSANEEQTSFINVKPDVLIINQDENIGLTKSLINYIEENTNIVNVNDNEEAIDDALFYRDVNYIIYIPNNYRNDILAGQKPQIDIKSTGDYQSSLANMMLTRYLKLQEIYLDSNNEEETIKLINDNLSETASVEIKSSVDTATMYRISNYFNFASYSIMASVIFIICLVLSSFHENNIKKRTIISSMDYKKHNCKLLLSSLLFSLIVWLVYVILGIIIIGSSIISIRGLVYIFNTLLFTFVSLTIALFISTIVNNKDAVSGIVNVVALGSAFLCGAFVPAEWLPDAVLKFAHILPAYWFINSNNLLIDIEKLNLESLKPIIKNSIILLIFAIIFIIVNNIISKHKQKIG